MSDDPFSLIHVIAQKAWHDPAFIVGNREGLERLRDTIIAALSTEDIASMDAFADDGEGFRLHVCCVTDAGMETVPYGYTATDLIPPKPWPAWMKQAR